MLQENVAHDGDEGGGSTFDLLAHAGEYQAQIVVPHSCRDSFPAAEQLLQQLALGQFHAVSEIVELLLALPDDFHHASESTVLREFGQVLAADEQAIAHRAGQALVQCRGMIFDFLARADDEFRRG